MPWPFNWEKTTSKEIMTVIFDQVDAISNHGHDEVWESLGFNIGREIVEIIFIWFDSF